MSARLKKILGSVIALAAIAGVISCSGSSSNNDQGTSFTALGFYGFDDEGAVDPEAPISVVFAPISTDNFSFAGLDLANVLAGVGVQNRLSSQFIRTVRVDFEYQVPGADASLQIPNDSAPFPGILEATGSGSSSSGGATGGISQYFGAVQLVSPDVLSFLNVNVNRLPQLPFRMNVTARVVGVTQAGDTLTTNPIAIGVQFAEESEDGTGGGSTGDDGDSDSSESSSSSSEEARVNSAAVSQVDEAADALSDALIAESLGAAQ